MSGGGAVGVVAALVVSAASRRRPDRVADVAKVSPDRIDDAPATQRDVVANFAWRAFIALNWPSLSDASDRGIPDRERSFGDPGKRVWETFKSDYELFEVGDDGRRVAPEPWASYAGRNPCGVDNRRKTVASFAPFADFNQPSFAVGAPANPLVARNGAYTRYEIHFNEPEFTAFAANGWSCGLNLPDESHPGALSRRVGRSQGGMAASDRRRSAVRAGAFLCRARRDRRRRQNPCCGPHGLLRSATSRWSGSTSRSRPRAGRSGSGAPSSMSTTCRRRARGRPANPMPGRRGPLCVFRSVAAKVPLAAVRLARDTAGRLDESSEARSRSDAGRPAPSDRPVDHGREPRLLELARREGNRLGALHAGRRPMADERATAPAGQRRRLFSRASPRPTARRTNPTSRPRRPRRI